MADIEVNAEVNEDGKKILTPEALAFLAELQTKFGDRRNELLVKRAERQAEAARTGRLDFLPGTADIRAADWKVADQPRT